MEEVFRASSPTVSFMRIEDPEIGILFLWPLMTFLAFLGLTRRSLWRMPQAAGMLAVSLGSAMLLSYATITLRYHVDLWPLLMFPALFGVAPLARYIAGTSGWPRTSAKFALLGVAVLGASMTLLAAAGHRKNFIEDSGVWTREFCLRLIADKDLSRARREQVCAVTYEPGMK